MCWQWPYEWPSCGPWAVQAAQSRSSSTLWLTQTLHHGQQYAQPSQCSSPVPSHVCKTEKVLTGLWHQQSKGKSQMKKIQTLLSFKHKRKYEVQMLIWSIFAFLTELLCTHLPYIINHHKSLGNFMQVFDFSYNCDLEWRQRSLSSHQVWKKSVCKMSKYKPTFKFF